MPSARARNILAAGLVAVALSTAACGGGDNRQGEKTGTAGTGEPARPSPGGSEAAAPDGSKAGEQGGAKTGDGPQATVPGRIGPVTTTMQGVDLRVDPQLVLEIRRLEGSLVPTRKGDPPVFDDPASFAVAIDAAEIALAPEGLAALLNNYVFAYDGAPLSKLTVELPGDGRVRLRGMIHKGITAHFTMDGTLSATPDGDVKLSPETIYVAGIPVAGLLDLFGVELAELVETERARGVRIVEDELIFDPEAAVPPPRIRGAVSAVRLEGNRIVQVFGKAPEGDGAGPGKDKAKGGNFMAFRGNVLRFGKLTMADTDLRLSDADPDDPFHFYLAEYLRHLVAGVSKTQPDEGLVTTMPDYEDLGRER